MKHFVMNSNIKHIHIVICMYNNKGDQVYWECSKQDILCYQLTIHIHYNRTEKYMMSSSGPIRNCLPEHLSKIH